MTHALTVLVTSAGAITGWELTRRWFEKRKGQNRRASDPMYTDAPEIPE